jgi:hypothetical protein
VTRRTVISVALVCAWLLLTAGDCEVGDLDVLLERPGTIQVTNTGQEPAILAIVADDVRSYPTLAGGQTVTVRTFVGGSYQVRVVMTPENAAVYRQRLQDLRSLVERQIGGATTSQEKTQLFVDLAGLKAAILSLEQANAAGCNGHLELRPQSDESVSATVAWDPTSGDGFWDATCGSN